MPPKDRSLHVLSMIMSFRLPPLEQHPDLSPNPTASPLTFYDKHVDECHRLKRVRLLPSLAQSVALGLDKALASFMSDGRSFPVGEFYMLPYGNLRQHSLLMDACSVGDIYEVAIASQCGHVASILALHPNLPRYTSVFTWRKDYSVESSRESFSVDHFGLRVIPLEIPGMKDILHLLDEKTQDTVRQLAQKLPRLAIWDCYALQGEDLLRSMEHSTTLEEFPWQTCQTSGHTRPRDLAPPPDADSSAIPWVLPPLEDENTGDSGRPLGQFMAAITPRRSERIGNIQKTKASSSASAAVTKSSKKPKHEQKDGERVKPPKVSGRRRGPARPYQPDPIHFIQHAWSLAADADSTIIVFDCGNYQRIGVRHRASQTLYLSGLIDTRTCEDPEYGKLQAGIHLAIVQDALSRLPKLNADEETTTDNAQQARKRRRSDENPVGRKSKRRKIDANHVLVQSNKKMTEYAPPALLLMYLKYRSYNSPSPTSFIRAGPMLFPGQQHDAPTPKPKAKTTYASHEYLTLTIGPEIGHGAVGNVHKGELRRQMPDGRPTACEVVVKLAFTPEQQEKLYHEYTVYHHLFSSDVKLLGVVRIFGLFVDVEGGSSVLVMSDGGKPLGFRLDKAGQVVVPSDEREAFLDALETIHEAGVQHNDLRSWNLLVDERGGVSIIDFDSAEIEPSAEEYSEEEDIMISLLDGEYVHP